MAVTIPSQERFFIIGILSGGFGGVRILRVPGRGDGSGTRSEFPPRLRPA
jgi:hypothetical protein